jgi:CelD/BcsL family acetyltransferase involved in cellulose biosynthesis
LLDESSHGYEFAVHEEITDDLLQKIAEVHSARQNQLLGQGRPSRDAPFSDDNLKRLIGRLLAGAARSHRLRIYCLNIDKQLAAFGIVFANQGDTICWLIAFDDQFKSFSPSRLVFQYMYTTEMERYGTRRMNLMLGYTRTKKELSTDTYESWCYEIPNNYWVISKIKRPLYELIKKSASPVRRFTMSRPH